MTPQASAELRFHELQKTLRPPKLPAIYGDTQRLDPTYSIRFSLKNGKLMSVWDPAMPNTDTALQSLAEAYCAALQDFAAMASRHTGKRVAVISWPEAKLAARVGLIPAQAMGAQIVIVDTLDVHVGPVALLSKEAFK